MASTGAGLLSRGGQVGLRAHRCRPQPTRHHPAAGTDHGDGGEGHGGTSGEPGDDPLVLFSALAGRCRGQGSPQVLSPHGDLSGAGRPGQGVLGGQTVDQCRNFRRHRRRQPWQWPLLVRHGNRQRLAVERELAGKALEGHDTQRVKIGRGRGGFTRNPFGCQVGGCSDQHPRAGEWRAACRLGDPEVGDLHLPALADQQVPRLDIAVHQASGMRGLQGGGGLSDEAHRSRRIKRSLVQQPGQRWPVDQFQHQVGRIRCSDLLVVVYRRDARMGQQPGIPGLGSEPGQAFLMSGIAGPQQLHRHRPAQHEVGGPPDLTHRACGDTVVQPVPPLKQQSGRYRNAGHCPHGGLMPRPR